jgi:4-hydroxy-tetrahydrodipicolinate synthase
MFHGSMVALVTPMAEDGSVQHDALADLIEWHVESGTDAVVPVGTTGESATLSHAEHCALIRFVVERVAGRVPVIAGTGANATSEAVELTRCAMEAGADAALLVTPYYNKPTQEGLYLHYRAVAEAVPMPQILYNVPGRTACDLLPETVERLSHIANIVGIKEATGSLDRAREILDRCGGRLDVYSGDDALAREIILAGGKGVISVRPTWPRARCTRCAPPPWPETPRPRRGSTPSSRPCTGICSWNRIRSRSSGRCSRWGASAGGSGCR